MKSAPDALPTGTGLSGVLDPLLGDPALGARRTAVVVDVATGKRLYGSGADEALTPASTTKIATAVAALSAMGGEHRLTTRAALEPDTREVVLVGGGDPTLTARADAEGWADLRTLAASTAAALKKRGLTQVTLSYDTTLFAGTQVHPIGVNPNLAAVTALSADEGRTDDSTSGPTTRVSDPAADATRKFAEFLKAAGIKTSSPGPSKATTRATTLATVSSPPLSVLVERMLTNSDNDIAEALARQTAVATGVRADFMRRGQGRPGATEEAGTAVDRRTDQGRQRSRPRGPAHGEPPDRPPGQGRGRRPPRSAPRPHRPSRRRFHRHPRLPLHGGRGRLSSAPRPAP